MATRVNTAVGDSASANTIAAASINVTAGNRLVVQVKYGGNVTLTSGMVTDGQGNTYTLDADWSDGNAGVNAVSDHGVYSTVCGSTGANVVTFTPGGSANRIGIVVREYSGLGAFPGSVLSITRNLTGTSSTPASGTLTPSAATGVLFALITTAQSVTWEADFLNDTTTDSGSRFHTAVDESVTAVGQEANATLGGNALWDCGCIWYPDAQLAGAVRTKTRTTMGVGR